MSDGNSKWELVEKYVFTSQEIAFAIPCTDTKKWKYKTAISKPEKAFHVTLDCLGCERDLLLTELTHLKALLKEGVLYAKTAEMVYRSETSRSHHDWKSAQEWIEEVDKIK